MVEFSDFVKGLKDDMSATSMSYDFLYKFCNNASRPWSNPKALKERFMTTTMLLHVSIDKSYITDKDGKTVEKNSFDGNTGVLCTDVAKKLSTCEIIPENTLLFDGSVDDMLNLAVSIIDVIDFEKAIAKAVSKFYKARGLRCGSDESVPSYTDFASTFLHVSYPDSFIPFNTGLYDKSKRLFFAEKCIVGDCEMTEETKQVLLAKYQKVDYYFSNVRKEPKDAPIYSYLQFCTLIYALCEYIKETIEGDDYNPILIAIMLLNSVRTESDLAN